MRSSFRPRAFLRAASARWRRGATVARARRTRVCDDVEQWVARSVGTKSQILFAPRQITRKLPRTIERELHAAYVERRVANLRGRYLVPVERARLLDRRGVIMLPDGSLAAESVYGRERLDPGSFARPNGRRCITKRGDYFSLIVLWSMDGNYYHWFHDTLTRLFGVVDLLPRDTQFIVPADLKPFQIESLRLVGLDDRRLVSFTGEEAWELETLHFAPAVTNSGSDRREADVWLRDAILTRYGITPQSLGRKIFVSRRDAPRRRLVNETEVEDFLRGHGFETWIPERLTLREQVALFAESAIVVSTHGAGFTNMLFAAPPLKVLDMIDPGKLGHGYVFWAMADALEHEYWYFVAESVPQRANENDTIVPLEKLAATIERMERDFSPTS